MRPLLATLLLGCEAIAGVDVTYVDASHDGGADADAKVVVDAGPLIVEDGEAISAGGTCGCDVNSGQGCCILPASAPFCTSTGEACAAAGGMFVRCQKYDVSSESECCWSNGAAPGGSSVYAAKCESGPTACTEQADCTSGECKKATCQGITIGACGTTPKCP